MVDSIDDEAAERVDEVVDPSKLNSAQIEDQLRSERRSDGSRAFDKNQAEAFASRVAQRRDVVVQKAQRQLVDQISEPSGNGQPMLHGKNPETGRNTFVGTASKIEVDVADDGTVYGRNVDTGTRAEVGRVNLRER